MKGQRTMVQIKEQSKTPEKEVNKMEISNPADAKFKTLVIRMLKELIGFFNSTEMIQSEMKEMLIEIKTIYRESTAQWMKMKIKSMIWNIRKKKKSNQYNKKKNESQNSKIV